MEQNSNKSSRGERPATKQKLITNSSYNGIWLDALQCMEGYGIYVFPDGSQYRGYFYRGHFHGYGTLYLSEPYGFTFKGTFIHGQLTEVEDMWFDDGLSVDADFDGWSIDFSSWKYCTEIDRRYADEHFEGMQPVGPASMLTAERPTRQMHKNCYEVERGVYDPVNKMISKRPAPFPKSEFVACPLDAEWILQNCRHGPLAKINVSPNVCHKIIHNNLYSELEVQEHIPSCNYDQKQMHKDYFGRLCQPKISLNSDAGGDMTGSEASVGHFAASSSSTSSSFSNTSLGIDVQEILFQVDEYERCELGRNLSQEDHLAADQHAAPTRLSFKV